MKRHFPVVLPGRPALVRTILALILLAAAGCRRAPAPVNEVVAVSQTRVPLDPGDPAWDQAPEHVAKLLLQDLVEPRLLKPSTAAVQVRAITNGSEIAFRLQWADAGPNDLPGVDRFTDACAIQIPKKIEAKPPDPQMGERGRPVDITFWRAAWQAALTRKEDSIRELYPNAAVDHYPFEAPPLEAGSAAQKEMAKRYAPAEALGNRRSGPRQSAVEDLVAEGPGTLAPAPAAGSKGQGARTRDGWAVVISRRLPEGLAPQPPPAQERGPAAGQRAALVGPRTQIAFAVWEGSQQEAGARKMRTGWIPLSLRVGK